MSQLAERIKDLEEMLLHSDMQENPTLINELLAETFEEIGYSGSINSRQAVVDWLLIKNKKDRWLLSDFKVSVLSADIVLAVYRAQKVWDGEQTTTASTRSSIWKRHGRQWKMMFHQASKLSK